MKYKKFKKLLARFNKNKPIEQIAKPSNLVGTIPDYNRITTTSTNSDYKVENGKLQPTDQFTSSGWDGQFFISPEIDEYLGSPNYKTAKWVRETYPETYDAFLEQQEEQFQLFCKKHKDYGAGNLVHETVEESLDGIFIRMKDKLNRVHRLNNTNGEIENESLVDSLNDISNYANIAIIFLKGHWGK